MSNSPIIDAEELIFTDKEKIILADVRTGPSARKDYETAHLLNAIFFDLDNMLASKNNDPANGGRHPLPKLEEFCKMLGNAGINSDSIVVAYDDKNAANAASRLWWMMKAAGHKNIRVLNGGMQAALEAGYPLTDKAPDLKPEMYPCQGNWQLPLVNIDEAESFALDPGKMLIDVRESKRYTGETEPIDLVAGHIPGAFNLPFANNLDANGKFLKPEILREQYLKFVDDKAVENIAVHCGSGVTACHTVLGMYYAGLGIPALYVGSWSEWSRSGKEIARENVL